jgi:hypothetical protein
MLVSWVPGYVSCHAWGIDSDLVLSAWDGCVGSLTRDVGFDAASGLRTLSDLLRLDSMSKRSSGTSTKPDCVVA